MPRQDRIDAPCVFQHIMFRGIERRDIFMSAHDRNEFLDRIPNILMDTRRPCCGRVLMDNYVHLHLRTGRVPIAAIMRRIGLRVKGDERISGGSDSVLDALKRENGEFEEKYRLRTRRIGLDRLSERVAEYFGLGAEHVKTAGKGRRIVHARSVLCYLAAKKLGYTCAEISHLYINPLNGSRAVGRAEHDPMQAAFEKGILHP